MDKLKKLNLGKNMISKLDNLVELKKAKTLIDLIIEDNPVIVLKESVEILKTLPIKSKQPNNKESNGSLSIPSPSFNPPINLNGKKLSEKFTINSKKEIEVNNLLNSNSNTSTIIGKSKTLENNEQLPEINLDSVNKIIIQPKNIVFKSEEISPAQTKNVISFIEKEWQSEYNYIVDNGYNGYNTKRLKESKIVSGHAEVESGFKLNIFGNALEVLDQEDFYKSISILFFEFFNIDLITNKSTIDKLKKFKLLKKIIFSNNNLHSLYQLVKLEDISDLESISVTNNEITNSTFLKYFLIYRFQNLKLFNEVEISQIDILNAKKMFEYFDKCISHHENKDHKIKESTLSCEDVSNTSKKKELYSFVQHNLMDLIEEITDELI